MGKLKKGPPAKTTDEKTCRARKIIYWAGKEGWEKMKRTEQEKGETQKIIRAKEQTALEYVAKKNINATKCQSNPVGKKQYPKTTPMGS